MVAGVELPSIERVATLEHRRTAVLSVPGLSGDLQQDLGARSLAVEIEGSLHGDQARDDFLHALRPPFQASDPVAFVADIITATTLDQVLIEALDVEEVNDAATGFRYHLVLREYVEPPAPAPAPGLGLDDLGLDVGLDLELGDLASLGLDGLGLPDLLGAIPAVANPVPPLLQALAGVKAATSGLGSLLDPLKSVLGA